MQSNHRAGRTHFIDKGDFIAQVYGSLSVSHYSTDDRMFSVTLHFVDDIEFGSPGAWGDPQPLG